MKIWILTAAYPDGDFVKPTHPQVLTSKKAAIAQFRREMTEEWETNGPSNKAGRRKAMPSDPQKAHDAIKDNLEGMDLSEPWGLYDLTCHEIEVP